METGVTCALMPALRSALHAKSYQVLVNGHYLKGMRYEDLAEALSLPLGTVKTHLHRAKRQLRHLLETEYR